MGEEGRGFGNPSRAKVPPKVLARWAEHTSEREQVATEAERGLVEIKKFRLMEAQLASRQIVDYDAVVSKCTPFGCFVEIPELAVSGLVHISLLSHKFVKFNESDQSLSAFGGGSWHVGDKMKVHVAKVTSASGDSTSCRATGGQELSHGAEFF